MEEKRKSRGLIITLIIINLLLLGAVGYFVFDKYFTDNISIGKKDQTDKNTTSEISLSNDTVVKLEKKIASIHDYCDVYGYFYDGRDIFYYSVSDEDKIDSAINYLDLYSLYKEPKLFNNGYYYELSSDTVASIKETLKSLFGPDQTFNPGNNYTSTSSIIYVDGKYLLAENGCGFEGNRALSYTIKAVKGEEGIEIYKLVGYYFPTGYNEASKTQSILTTDKGGSDTIFSKTSDITDKDWITNEWDYFIEQMKSNTSKFDTFKFTFKLDTTGNYYFYSSEIVHK